MVPSAPVRARAVSATTLISTFGRGGFNVGVVVAMLAGGVIAAPVAAWVIRHIPARPLGIATATLLLVTNVRELLAWADLKAFAWGAYGAIAALVIVVGKLLARRQAAPRSRESWGSVRRRVTARVRRSSSGASSR